MTLDICKGVRFAIVADGSCGPRLVECKEIAGTTVFCAAVDEEFTELTSLDLALMLANGREVRVARVASPISVIGAIEKPFADAKICALESREVTDRLSGWTVHNYSQRMPPDGDGKTFVHCMRGGSQ